MSARKRRKARRGQRPIVTSKGSGLKRRDMTAASHHAPGPSLLLAIVVIAAGVIGAATCVGLAVDRFVGMLDGPTATTPGSFTWSLGQGTWLISQRTGSSASAGPVSFTKDNARTLSPSEIGVKGPGGEVLPVSQVEGETVTKGSTIYTGVAEFSAHIRGDYSVTFSTPGRDVVLLTPSLGQMGLNELGFVAGGAASGLVALIGAVLLIVGMVRRRNARQAAFAGNARDSGWPRAPGPYQVGPQPGTGRPAKGAAGTNEGPTWPAPS
jgi:hypothetical protein